MQTSQPSSYARTAWNRPYAWHSPGGAAVVPVDNVAGMEPPRPPRMKTPEDLARELEERLRQDAIRARRWRQRRETYRAVTILIGLLPSLSLILAGMISNNGFMGWIERAG